MVQSVVFSFETGYLNPLLFNAALKLPWTSVLLKLMVANLNHFRIISVVLFIKFCFVQIKLHLWLYCVASSYLSVSNIYMNFYSLMFMKYKIYFCRLFYH